MTWLRKTLVLALLAVLAVVVVKIAAPWLTAPVEAPASATE
jgi:hypothetical protein